MYCVLIIILHRPTYIVLQKKKLIPHFTMFNPFSMGNDFIRQNPTSEDSSNLNILETLFLMTPQPSVYIGQIMSSDCQN